MRIPMNELKREIAHLPPLARARAERELGTAENLRKFYYLGLQDWIKGRKARLKDTCGTGQDVFKRVLKSFGYGYLVKEGETT